MPNQPADPELIEASLEEGMPEEDEEVEHPKGLDDSSEEEEEGSEEERAVREGQLGCTSRP